jgi:flagellar protein FlaG
MNSDESNVTDIKQGQVEKVSAVQNISAVQAQRQDGNNLPGNAANSEPGVELAQAVNTEKLDKAIQQINENEQVVRRELKFNIDEDSGKTVIKIMDLATNEVIRQIPNEEALVFARKLNEGAYLKLFSEYI